MSAIKDICDYAKQFGKDALRESLQRDSGPANAQSASSATNAPPSSGATSVPPPTSKSKPSNSQTQSPIPWPPIKNAQDIISTPAKRPPEIIKGLLHQSSKMVLGGGSKSFKTWSILDLGLSVATGQPWWGFPTHKSRVLYVNLELPEWSIGERIREIKDARVIMDTLTNLDLWNLRGLAASFDAMQKDILQAIGQTYGMIIIDPIYKVYGDRDENSAGEMGTLLNLFASVSAITFPC